MPWKSYKELNVWQKSIELVKETYFIVSKFPIEEKYNLSDQMRRAAISISSNIAEGHGRNSEKEFKQFLSVAKGSVCELETQIIISKEIGYVNEKEIETALDLCSQVSRMITKLITSFSF